MDIEKVFKLIDAGFTKEDIMKMAEKPADPEPKKEEPKKADPEPKKEEPKKEEPKNDPTKEVTDAITKAFNEAMKPFNEMLEKQAKLMGMPSINDVQPKGIEDIISDFFKGE